MKKKIKNEKLAKRILSYSAVAGAFVAITPESQAQVTVTDPNPDVYLTGSGSNSYNIDINNDMINDFTIVQAQNVFTTTYTSSGYTYTYTYAYNSVGILIPNANAGIVGTSWEPDPIPHGDVINVNDAFSIAGSVSNLGWNYYGVFVGTGDKYIGVRVDVGGQMKYGWILLNVDMNSAGITIKSYGIETTADGVHAGDPVGVYISNVNMTNVQANTAEGNYTPSAKGTAFYVVQLETDAPPCSTEILSGLGAPGATVAAQGSMAVTAGTPATFYISGLAPNTAYTFYVAEQDTGQIISARQEADFTTLTTGIENADAMNFQMFPNPATEQVVIDYAEAATLIIRNESGDVMLTRELPAGRNNISLNGLAAGNYLIEIRGDSKSAVKKLVVK